MLRLFIITLIDTSTKMCYSLEEAVQVITQDYLANLVFCEENGIVLNISELIKTLETMPIDSVGNFQIWQINATEKRDVGLGVLRKTFVNDVPVFIIHTHNGADVKLNDILERYTDKKIECFIRELE